MNRLLPSLFIAALLGSIAPAEEAAVIVREIDLKDVPAAIFKSKVTEPKVIASAEELAKVFTDANVAGRIKKAVDFEKEKLLYFAWSGSGGDKLTHSIEKGEKGGEKGAVVKFQYRPGLTRDLRGHHKLFALPKDAAFVVAAGR